MGDVIHFPAEEPRSLALLAVGTVAEKPVRFFRPPALPDFPWVSWSDLLAASGFPPAVRREFEAKLRSEWGRNIRTASTNPGKTAVVPHWMAQGIVASAIDTGHASRSLEVEYTVAGATATNILTDGLDAAALGVFFVDAMARSNAR